MGLFSCILLSVLISRCQVPENVQLDKKKSSGDNHVFCKCAIEMGRCRKQTQPWTQPAPAWRFGQGCAQTSKKKNPNWRGARETAKLSSKRERGKNESLLQASREVSFSEAKADSLRRVEKVGWYVMSISSTGVFLFFLCFISFTLCFKDISFLEPKRF